MDTLLQQGDFAVNPNGLPVAVSGKAELVQRAEIRLHVRRGSFSYDSKLGSRLYTLRLSGSDLDVRARELTEEALTGLPGVTVQKVRCTALGGNRALLRVTLSTPYGPAALEIEFEGQEGCNGNV